MYVAVPMIDFHHGVSIGVGTSVVNAVARPTCCHYGVVERLAAQSAARGTALVLMMTKPIVEIVVTQCDSLP